jgi:hypothetical protein
MLKNVVISMMIFSSLTMARNKVNDKNWFIELGYQTSCESWEGLTDNLYLEIGRNFSLSSEFSLAPSLGFIQVIHFHEIYP